MQVFKLCMKILKKNIPSMSIYLGVFLIVSVIMTLNMTTEIKKETSFVRSKADMAVISEESSPLIDGLTEELSKIANFVHLPDETEKLQDALYFRSVSYILRIPAGFTEGFMKGEEVQLEKIVVPNSYSNVYIDLSIEKYLNTARLYVNHLEGISPEELIRLVESDMAKGAEVELLTNGEKPVDHMYANYFFNYLVYSLFSVLILGINALMLVFNNDNLRKRNTCAPIKTGRMNIQFLYANLVFTFISWFIMVGFCIAFNIKNSNNLNTVYFLINSLVFAVCCSAISFLIGNLISGPEAVSAVCTVVALGSAFISGAFVPQELLGSTVLRIASFTPSYWYIKANNTIAQLTRFDYARLEPVFSSMLIQVGFAVAFVAVALVIGKKKRYAS